MKKKLKNLIIINKTILAALLIFIALFISGCDTSNSSGGSISDTKYSTGTQGISLGFLANQPPDKIYLNGGNIESDISIEVKNLGRNTIEAQDIEFSITGYDQSILDISSARFRMSNNLEEDLLGKSQYMPDGGFAIHTVGKLSIKDASSITTSYNPTLVLNAFYKYKTVGSIPICVDPKAYDPTVTSRSCIVSDVTVSVGQGAPISVTKVEQVSTPKKAIFRIYFSNTGGGTVFDSTYPFNSVKEDGLDYKNIDYLRATRVSVGGTDITGTCKPDERVRVQDSLYCELELNSGDNAFSTVLNIELEYNYKVSIQKQISIINLGTD